ncbi:MAG: 1-acyl-sn-glycerol-3-phosphate acyltransferase [Bacteriovoracaceae bacterium]
MIQPIGFKFLHKLFLFLVKHYFQAEVKGLENIPVGPCLFVGNHNAIAFVNPEVWIFGSYYFLKGNSLKVLGHDLVLRVPGISYLAKEYLRYIPNNLESAKQSLKDGSQVLVYPGGAWESSRPSSERDRIDFKNRSGFVRLAREASVPIVPIVSTGGHDGIFVWKRGHNLARALQFHRLFRIDTFPIGFSFPLILHIGPFVPFIPLPKKVILEILPPISIDELIADDDVGKANEIVKCMQRTMDKNVELLPRSQR